MKYSSKGFTLIELLSVIVILAIIAMIATPIILKIVNNARRAAAAESAYGIIHSGEIFHSDRKMDNPNITFQEVRFKWVDSVTSATIYDEETETYVPLGAEEIAKFEFNGNAPIEGEIIISHTGKVSIDDAVGLVMNGFLCKHKNDNPNLIECSNN